MRHSWQAIDTQPLWLHRLRLGAATAASASHRKVPSSVAPCGCQRCRGDVPRYTFSCSIIPSESILDLGISLFLPGLFLEYSQINRRHCPSWNDAERTRGTEWTKEQTLHHAGLRGLRHMAGWQETVFRSRGLKPLPVMAVVLRREFPRILEISWYQCPTDAFMTGFMTGFIASAQMFRVVKPEMDGQRCHT